MNNENKNRYKNILMTSMIAAILITSTSTLHSAYAASGFAGDYDPANWTFTNTNSDGFVDTSDAPNSIILVGGDNNSGEPGDTDYTINVACGGEISFDWEYQTIDGPFFDPAGYLINGNFTHITDDEGSHSQSGTTTVMVSDADTFGYRVHTIDNIFGEGALTNITNLQTPDCIIPVEIDIKPGSDPNCFNNNGNGVIPVAIFGSEDLDVNDIDAETVELEGMEVKAVGKSNKLLAHIEDLNNDGIDDLIVQIEDEDGIFEIGSTTATLTGSLFDGTSIQGTDDICITQ